MQQEGAKHQISGLKHVLFPMTIKKNLESLHQVHYSNEAQRSLTPQKCKQNTFNQIPNQESG